MRRAPSFTRADRLQNLMLDEVERLLAYEVRSPLAQQVKVVAGKLSGDLSHLRCMYVLRDGAAAGPHIQQMLDKSTSFIGRTLVEMLDLNSKPHVTFVFDLDAQRAQRVQSILAAEAAKRGPIDPEAYASSGGPDDDADGEA